jgi:SAM-dependent methyltransferase
MTMRRWRYDNRYFDVYRQGARASAEVLVPIIVDLLRPKAVVDLGCGVGTWLRVFEEHGVADVCGVDGEYIDLDRLEISPGQFIAADLRQGVSLNKRFDLAMSLEVAEHLPAECAERFVRSLTELAPAVLFSAAIPEQGGTGHVNEQWPDYWAAHFDRCGFVAVDCLRPKIWHEARVVPWYAQNALLFLERKYLESHPVLKSEYERSKGHPLSLVHPGIFHDALHPSARQLLKMVGKLGRKLVGRRRN